MMREERWLRLLLRVGGATMCLAAFAIFMPTSWMAGCHRLLGLGDFPTQPVVEYLARATSGCFAIFGVVLLVLSTDVSRYGPLISVLAVGYIAIACVLLAFMAPKSGLPALYSGLDAVSAVVFFVAVLILQRRLARRTNDD